jgi:ABC-type transporter Mla MlaB component
VRHVPTGEKVDQEVVQRLFLRTAVVGEEVLLSIDLRQAQRFDTVGLAYLLALIRIRARNDRLTRIELPEQTGGLIQLDKKGFLEAARAMAGAPLRLLLPLLDVERLVELQSRRGDEVSHASSDANFLLAYLRSKGHFTFRAYSLESAVSKVRMVDDELRRWTEPLALALLGKHLKGAAEWDVARVVVHELLANVQEHPHASVVLVGSEMNLPERSAPSAPAELTIVIWDDGHSIIETLRQALVSRGTIRAADPPHIDRYRMCHPDRGPAAGDARIISSDWSPDLYADEEELLLASILPGISRKSYDDGATERERDTFSGYGLYFFSRHVIDVFNGSFELHSGKTELRVEAEPDPEHGARYRASFRSRSAESAITGNMIIARLPTHAG